MDTDADVATDGRWMTYAELAEIRRIDKPSALKLALRHGWMRRKNNRGQMQVCVPPDWTEPKDKSTAVSSAMSADLSRAINAFETGLTAFTEHAALTERAERAERDRDAERTRADALQTDLTAAREAIAALEAAQRMKPAPIARLRAALAAWRRSQQ